MGQTIWIDRDGFGMDLPAAADMGEIARRIGAELGDGYEVRVGVDMRRPADQGDTPEPVYQRMLGVVSGYLDELAA